MIDPTVATEIVLIAERPADGLVNLAEARGAEMIIVGGNGRGPLAGAILGSVPYRLLHRSSVPVLVVPSA